MNATGRKIVSIIAALVPVADKIFGWHLSWQDLAGIVIPLVTWVFSEAHAEKKTEAPTTK